MTLRLLVATSDGDVEQIKNSVETGTPLYFTAPQDSERGDPAVIFTRGALVARGQISSDPDPEQSFGHRPVWRALVGNFEFIDPPIPLEEVMRQMPDTWLWPTHPHRSFCTPRGDHPAQLEEIVNRALATRVAPPELQPEGGAAQPSEPGRGYEADAAVRKAVELRAMALAEEHYRAQGFVVENTAARRPYDLRCMRDALEVRVEVKGTCGDGAEVEVTIGEVLNARGTGWRTDLFVVSKIEVASEKGEPTASGGKVHIIEEWQPADEDLLAIRFRCTVRVPPLGGDGPNVPTDPTRLEIFTIGQKGVASTTALQEIITRLEVVHVVDAREHAPSRGAWSRGELTKLLGRTVLAAPSGGDPAAVIVPLSGRILLLGTEKDPFDSQARIAFGDQHPEWEIVHILHHSHTKSPVDEAECIAHSELVAAIRDRPNNEYRFFYLDAYSAKDSAGAADA